MKKRLLAISLCMALAVTSLAGCGTSQTEKSTAASTTETKTETATATTSNGNEVVKLRMMGYNSETSRATYLKYLDEKLPNIEIEFQFVSTDNFDNILNSQLQAGEGPDIIEVGGQTKLLASAGYLLNLKDQKFIEKYADSGLLAYTVGNGIYAAPLQSWFEGIFYNKKIFREKNIAIPKTWDEFIQIHKDLEAAGIKAQTMGAQSYEPMMKQSIALVNNLYYSDEKNLAFDEQFNEGKVKLAEAWLPAVTEWYKIVEAGCLKPEMLGLSYDQALDEFATEKAAMWECGPWAVETILAKNPNIEFGMFPIPGTDPEKAGWLVGGPGSAWAINAKSKNIEAALQVLEVTATEEAQQALAADNAGSSFVEGVQIDLGDIYADCEEAFKAGNVYAPWTAVWTNGNAVTEAYGKSLQEVLSGSKTVQEALADADSTNNDLLEAMQ